MDCWAKSKTAAIFWRPQIQGNMGRRENSSARGVENSYEGYACRPL
jgi:hypothetical protein